MKQKGCCNTLAESNKAFKLELPRAWEPLDNSKPSQINEETSSQCMLLNGNKVGSKWF